MTTILEYAEHVGITLTPVQTLLLKCLYGIPLDPKVVVTDPGNAAGISLNEVEYLLCMYYNGRSSISKVVEGKTFRESFISVGRQSGKTLLGSLICAFELHVLMSKLDPFGTHHSAWVCALAYSKDMAGHLLKKTREFTVGVVPTTETGSETQYKYRNGKTVSLISRSMSTHCLRGMGGLRFVLLDELAHSPAEKDAYTAIFPCTASVEGRLVSISTPLPNSYFDRRCLEARDRGDLYLSFRTSDMNPREWKSRLSELKYDQAEFSGLPIVSEDLPEARGRCSHCGRS